MLRAREIDAFVVWVLSIIIAAMFLLTGVPKLVGLGTVGLAAAAMRGFPTWIRVVVGFVEVVGAICLLIPATATVAALVLAFVMLPATATQLLSGEPGVYVPLTALVLLLFVAWRRNATLLRDGYRGFAGAPHPLLYDGVIAGVIGALVIAAWFFLVDSIAGRPFFTPALLGQGLFRVFGPVTPSDGAVTFVLVYTVFHFAAFMLVGLVASLIVHLARREPSILFGFLILFVATEVGIYGLVALLDVATPLGRHAWLQIMASNLLACAAMGLYFVRTHAELGDQFRHALDREAFVPSAKLPRNEHPLPPP
jgi:uncharacterized membrane protein YphA (DoxX/SURF4 family)